LRGAMTTRLVKYSVEVIPPDKCPRIWGHFETSKGTFLSPLVNLRKPKYMDKGKFDKIVRTIRIDLKGEEW